MASKFKESLIYFGTWLGLEAGLLIVRFLPRGLLLFLSRNIADGGFYVFGSYRRRSLQNLRQAFGNTADGARIEAIAKKSLRNFFQDFVELGVALNDSAGELRKEIPIDGWEHLEAARKKGQGVIALSAHLGNFFLVGSRLAVEGLPTSVLVKPTGNGRLAEMMDRYRLALGQKTIHSSPREKAARDLIKALRQNETVVVIADEFRNRGLPVPFFGRTVLARRGPATLALRTGAALLPVYLLREKDGNLRLVIEPELEISRSGRLILDLGTNTVRITQWLERVVGSYPDQWNWMNVRWSEPREEGTQQSQSVAKSA